MNRKFSGFFKLADDLDFFIVFGAVNSPVVQNTIARQSKASVIFQIELFREIISQFKTGLLAFCYSNSTPFNGVFLRLLL